MREDLSAAAVDVYHVDVYHVDVYHVDVYHVDSRDTRFVKDPMPSISTVTVSPSFK